MNLLTAWPLLLDPLRPDVHAALQADDWMSLYRALVDHAGIDKVALVTRLPVMWLTLLLAALVYRWAQQAWGSSAGLLAVGLLAFDPSILAHGQLNTTDVGVTAFGFAGCYALARYIKRPSSGAYLGTGLGLGAALATKASGAFWIGALGLIVGIAWLKEPGTTPARKLKAAITWGIRLAGWIALALAVLWGAYLFELRPLTPGGLPIPAASHWAGLPYIRSYMATGQTTFLAGRLVSGGSQAYFPLALAVKTPIPLIVGFAAALIWSLRHGAGPRWSALPLLIVPGAYFIVAILMALNIGHRHMLPLFPFVYVFIAQLAGKRTATAWPRRGFSRLAGAGLAIWYVLGTAAIYPYDLTYFNELSGGPDRGYHYLADSSVDWGQGLKALKRYLDRRDGGVVRLSVFTSIEPALYAVTAEPLPPTLQAPITVTSRFAPPPGAYIISAVTLQGIWVLDPDTYDWFRHREPVTRVAHVLFVYEVPPMDPEPGWVAQCATPLAPLTAAEVGEGFGRETLRIAHFDCEQSWLYPAGEAGWTVLPGNAPLDSWRAEHLAGVPLSFQQRDFWSHPALTIYEQRETPAGAVPPKDAGYCTPSDWPIDKVLAEGALKQAPIHTLGPLTFLGYEVTSQKNALELRSYWRVEEIPGRPLSLMAHLLAADGATVAISDGLGAPIEVWRPGDIIVQRHRMEIPQGAASGPYWIETGAYWLDTMERWPMIIDGSVAGDRLILPVAAR